jgi:hypothetical protein
MPASALQRPPIWTDTGRRDYQSMLAPLPGVADTTRLTSQT